MAVQSTSYCTLEDVKNYMGITASKDTEDYLIEDFIDQISDAMDTYMDRTITSAEYTEYHDGNGKNTLYPNNYPITAVSGIWDDSNWTWASSSEITSTNYSYRNDRYIVYRNSVFTRGDQNIKIIYTAGYATVPRELKLACIEEVARRFKRRREVDVVTVTKDDGSITYYTEQWLPRTQYILDSYRRRQVL